MHLEFLVDDARYPIGTALQKINFRKLLFYAKEI